MANGQSPAEAAPYARALPDRSSEEVNLMAASSKHVPRGADDSSTDMALSSSTTRVDSESATLHEVDQSVELPTAWETRKANYHLRSNSSKDTKTGAIESDSPPHDPRPKRKQYASLMEKSRSTHPRRGTGERVKVPQFASNGADSVNQPSAHAVCCWGFGRATRQSDLISFFKTFGEVGRCEFPSYAETGEIMEVCWIPFEGEDCYEHAKKAFTAAQQGRLSFRGNILSVELDGEQSKLKEICSGLAKNWQEEKRKSKERERALNSVQMAADKGEKVCRHSEIKPS